MKQTILIVDDEIADTLATGFKASTGSEDLDFRTASDGGVALKMATEIRPALILLDIGLPTIDGLTVLSELQRRKVHTRIIMMSGYKTDLTTAIECVKAGACDYIVKGELQPHQLLQRIRRALILESTLNIRISNLSASAQNLIEEAAQLKQDYERLKDENEELQSRVKNEQYRLILAPALKVLSVVLAAGCVLLLKWAGVVQAPIVLPIVFLFLVILLLVPSDKIQSISANIQKVFNARIDLKDNSDKPDPEPRS